MPRNVELQHHSASLNHRPGRSIEYITTLVDGENARPLWWEKGFNDGCNNKVALANAFAEHDYSLLVADQNRYAISCDPVSGWPDVFRTRAFNNLSVIEAEGLAYTTLPAVGYSAGGPVLAAMVQEAQRRGWSCFDEATIVLQASTGMMQADNTLSLTIRLVQDMIKQKLHDRRPALAADNVVELPPNTRPIVKMALRNPIRTALEYGEIVTRRPRLLQLSQAVGWLAIGTFGEDCLVPMNLVDPVVADLFAGYDPNNPSAPLAAPDNVSYFTAYSSRVDNDGKIIGVRGSRHLDPFSFPTRVADAVAQQLLSVDATGRKTPL